MTPDPRSAAHNAPPANPGRRKTFLSLLAGLLSKSGAALADTIYLTPEQFIRQSFSTPPPAQFLWLDDAAQAQLQAVLGHRYPQARLRYWRNETQSLWILDEIGKEWPITAGFVVKDNAIAAAQVLVYRESRGDEIRFPGFLAQFRGAKLVKQDLDKGIDGISGATLSVAAMQRMARAALTLNTLAP